MPLYFIADCVRDGWMDSCAIIIVSGSILPLGESYSLTPKIAIAFSMNLSAEAITALAPDLENSAS